MRNLLEVLLFMALWANVLPVASWKNRFLIKCALEKVGWAISFIEAEKLIFYVKVTQKGFILKWF